MNLFIISFLFLLLPINSIAKGLSPIRLSHENYEQALLRHKFYKNFEVSPSKFRLRSTSSHSLTAESAKKPLKDLNTQEIPDVGSYADLENQFFYIRDTRFLTTRFPDFPRRLTWLYPDDGCYARAEVAKFELEKHNFPAPKKIFVFGNLYAATDNSPSGAVSWWYHVAVTYRVGAEVYVFDPAIEPKHPLTLTQWNSHIGGDHRSVKYSICDKETYDPSSDCINPTPLPEDEAYYEQKTFLQYEWDRIIQLQRDPKKELGDSPPWLTN